MTHVNLNLLPPLYGRTPSQSEIKHPPPNPIAEEQACNNLETKAQRTDTQYAVPRLVEQQQKAG